MRQSILTPGFLSLLVEAESRGGVVPDLEQWLAATTTDYLVIDVESVLEDILTDLADLGYLHRVTVGGVVEWDCLN